jgi:GNAT superfamily N-acetyltransferase
MTAAFGGLTYSWGNTPSQAPIMLAHTWQTQRLTMTDVHAVDTDSVLQCLAESADVAVLDPTFGPAPRAEIEDLITKSQSCANDPARNFQMQMIRQIGAETPVGYWHLTRVPTKERVIGVSILLLRPAHRGQGLGQELVQAAAAQLALGQREFWSRVYLRNTRAIEFWAQLGFDSLAKHRGAFVQPPAETPSIVMVKRLQAASREETSREPLHP